MNSSFSTITPNLQLAWDSTSLSAFKTCPRLYYYSIVLGYEPKQRSYHLTFGLIYHSALETYDHERSRGVDHDGATWAAVWHTLKETWDTKLQRPWNSGDSYKNRFTLVRTIVWYLDHFADDPITTVQLSNGKPAVELSFRYKFPHTFSNGETVVACGHLDRLGELGGSTWVVDRKTTKHELNERFFDQFTPDTQMTWYTLAGKVIGSVPVQGVILDGAQVLVNSSRFQR
ncbi:MAG TPA: PD-(D/E)XK nuclease family protein, partial [Pirellula sp.]|nr:PD-(D/E)XK nuclease family protein [Pirellula sp.]